MVRKRFDFDSFQKNYSDLDEIANFSYVPYSEEMGGRCVPQQKKGCRWTRADAHGARHQKPNKSLHQAFDPDSSGSLRGFNECFYDAFSRIFFLIFIEIKHEKKNRNKSVGDVAVVKNFGPISIDRNFIEEWVSKKRELRNSISFNPQSL